MLKTQSLAGFRCRLMSASGRDVRAKGKHGNVCLMSSESAHFTGFRLSPSPEHCSDARAPKNICLFMRDRVAFAAQPSYIAARATTHFARRTPQIITHYPSGRNYETAHGDDV